jgi:hypothetical protein
MQANWDVADLTDDEQPAKAAARGRGAPKSDILDQLTVSCTTKSTGKARFRCSGTGCQTSWAAPRQSGRVLSHAVDCRFLSAELKEEALEISAGNSLGAKVEAASSGASATDAFSGFRRAGADNKAKAREERVVKTNKYLLDLLCDASLAVRLVDNKKFRRFVDHLQPANGIFVSTTFSTSYIPAETARVTALSYQKLKTYKNLTIGYDGGTVKKGQSIYTIHITTPDTREPHFVKGDVASGVSHTGEHLKGVILSVSRVRNSRYDAQLMLNPTKVIDKIRRSRFAAIGSDSTGNTKLARELLVAIIPTILITPDPCHHCANLVKDISALEYFADIC